MEWIIEVIGEEVVCRSQSDYHDFFVDIDWAKLTLFWLNRDRKEDLDYLLVLLTFLKDKIRMNLWAYFFVNTVEVLGV